jgi:hypothetical protein
MEDYRYSEELALEQWRCQETFIEENNTRNKLRPWFQKIREENDDEFFETFSAFGGTRYMVRLGIAYSFSDGIEIHLVETEARRRGYLSRKSYWQCLFAVTQVEREWVPVTREEFWNEDNWN